MRLVERKNSENPIKSCLGLYGIFHFFYLYVEAPQIGEDKKVKQVQNKEQIIGETMF